MATKTSVADALSNAVTSAALGQRVALVMPGRSSALEALRLMIDVALDLNVSKFCRAHGNYRIEFSGDGVLRVFGDVDECRGGSADLVYAHDALTLQQMGVVTPMIATTAGQIVRFQ